MINIKKLHFFPIFMLLFDTQGFCRNVSVSGNKAFVAAGQAGVQVWDLNSGNKLHEYQGYSQDGSYIEFDDISIVQRDSVNDLIFVTESNKKVKIFIQVNLGNEVQKSGVLKNDLNELYLYCVSLKLNVVGLMCIPPIHDDSVKYFKKMLDLKQKHNFNELSMGMSSDYLDAIENQATFLRIGSNIFGKRV